MSTNKKIGDLLLQQGTAFIDEVSFAALNIYMKKINALLTAR
jgi:hypothetical protein